MSTTTEKRRIKRSISRKMLMFILITALLLSSTSILVGYRVYANTMDQHYKENTVKLARTALSILDADTVDHYCTKVYTIFRSLTPEELEDEEEGYLEKYSFLEEEEDWQFMRQQLQHVSQENELVSTMIVALDEDTGTVIYVVDSDDTDTYCPPGTLDFMSEEDIDLFVHSSAVISNTEEFGWLSSGATPIYGTDGSLTGFVVLDLSMNDVMEDRHEFLQDFVLIMALVTALLSGFISWSIRRSVVSPINQLARAAADYSYDQANDVQQAAQMQNHFTELKIHTGDELENLSTVMGEMETQLSEYIVNLTLVTAEKERIGAELNIAAQIQADMLPRLFPAFPEREEFDLYASMTPAKEVGGDFYDFFLIDEDHIGLVMADVSGKGVPAALFMVIAKTLIKNQAQVCDYSPAKVLMSVNDQLCEGNEAELFVTVWLAIIEISTGKGLAANAGHEHPVIRRAGGQHELVIYRHSPAVATMEGTRFREHPFELHPGDSLFVYTDGVPEACNVDNEFFGTDRMLEALNKDPEATPKDLLSNVREAITDFVGKAPQFDDITMMCFKYSGAENRGKELTLDATDENLQKVLAFVDEELHAVGCSEKTQMQIDVAVEELFVNIAHYAYTPEVGSASIWVKTEPEPKCISVTFIDRGIPYNPLDKPDPDVTLSAEERKIGGLGIYMVKKSMDKVLYEHRDGQNVLTIVKNLD